MVAPPSHNEELDQGCSGSSFRLQRPSAAVTTELMSIFISPLQQQNHTQKLKYNKLTYTLHPVMQKKKKEEKK